MAGTWDCIGLLIIFRGNFGPLPRTRTSTTGVNMRAARLLGARIAPGNTVYRLITVRAD